MKEPGGCSLHLIPQFFDDRRALPPAESDVTRNGRRGVFLLEKTDPSRSASNETRDGPCASWR
jgi:hypothetical protein